jgi:hypothetical protein
MAAINHDVGIKVGRRQLFFTDLDAHCIIVWLSTATSQDYMGVRITFGLDDRHFTVFVDA